MSHLNISKASVIRAEICWTSARQWLQTMLHLHKRGTLRKLRLGFLFANSQTVVALWMTGSIRVAGGKMKRGDAWRSRRPRRTAPSRRAAPPFPQLTRLSCSRFSFGLPSGCAGPRMPANVKRGRAANYITVEPSSVSREWLGTWAKALQERHAAYFNTEPCWGWWWWWWWIRLGTLHYMTTTFTCLFYRKWRLIYM